MVAVPALTPVTVPSVPTVAIAVLLLLHETPPTASLRVIVDPAQTDVLPEIGPGVTSTVTLPVAVQPDGMMYVMASMPVLTPVTVPVTDPIVAINTLLLLQIPPVTVSVSVVLFPSHSSAPATLASAMVTRKFCGQAVFENVISAVPDEMPVMIPETEPTVATAVLLLSHKP